MGRERALGDVGGCRVFVKLENLQITGSFKLRGAMNKLLSLDAAARSRGVVAASTGNHGAAVAHGLRALGMHGLVFAPTTASEARSSASAARRPIPR